MTSATMAKKRKTDSEPTQRPLAILIPSDLDKRLRLACAHRAAEGKEPSNRTTITIDALEQWLKRNGH